MTMPLLVEHFDNLLATPEDVEQLNRAIFQLAVQGKLVLQDSQDESAEILYKRIVKEKEENLNGRTPRLLPSVSQDEIPFEVPNNWVWTRLGEISNYGEATKSKAVEFTDETWVLDLEDIEKTTSRLIQRVRLKDRQFQSEKSVFQKGDVIYGKLRPYLDKVIVADEDGICSSELIPIKTYGNINPYYLRLALKRPDFIAYVNGKTYGVKMPRLGTQDARMALIPLPPLAEQQRIVARVEELFVQTRALAQELAHSQIELDGLNKSALSHLLASETSEEFNQHWDFIAEHFDLLFQAPEHVAPLRQSILELAVRGKLTRREAGDESAGDLLQQIHDEKANRGKEEPNPVVKEANKPFALPENWEWTTLDYISKKITDGEHIRPQITSAGVYFLSAKDVRADGPHFENALFVSVEDAEQYRKRCDPERGDILVVSRGATVGRTCIVNTDEVFCLLGSVILAKPEVGISSQYITFAMKSNDVQRQLIASSGATAQQAIYIRDIRKTIIPLPPLAEQERIVKRAEQLLSLCDALEARLQSAQEQRALLVAAVMSTVGMG